MSKYNEKSLRKVWIWKTVIVLFILSSTIAVLSCNKKEKASVDLKADSQKKSSVANTGKAENTEVQLPKLVDLGSNECIPCKMMMPILDELRNEYKDRLRVDFFDVWDDRETGRKYGVRAIPTQIFYDADGKELYRHEGFISKEDILEVFKENGIDLSQK